MQLDQIDKYITVGVSAFFIVTGVGFFGWFKILNTTNKLLNEQNAELKKVNKELTEDKINTAITLKSLQAQIDLLKSIPLTELAISMKEIAKSNRAIAAGNNRILRSLEASATVLARNTTNVENAAESVRTDLVKSANH